MHNFSAKCREFVEWLDLPTPKPPPQGRGELILCPLARDGEIIGLRYPQRVGGLIGLLHKSCDLLAKQGEAEVSLVMTIALSY